MAKYIPKYQIIRTEDFIQKSVAIGKRYERTPELIDAIDWALARKPHYFKNISTDFYLWVTSDIDNEEFPTVKVLYRIIEDEFKVILLDIEED